LRADARWGDLRFLDWRRGIRATAGAKLNPGNQPGHAGFPGAGRLRTEMDIPGPNGDPATFVQIFNGADGFMDVLIPAEKTAGRFLFPKGDPSKQGVGFGFSQPGPQITAPGKRTSKTENLGKQTIDGIDYEGTRTTTTVEDQASIFAVDEEWTAPSLGWIGLFKSSGLDIQVTAKLRILDRRDPDPALFQIPPDYEIRELQSDTKN
jgi:hypothetical protein